MFSRSWTAVFLALGLGSLALAKPPDLPVQRTPNCQPAQVMQAILLNADGEQVPVLAFIEFIDLNCSDQCKQCQPGGGRIACVRIVAAVNDEVRAPASNCPYLKRKQAGAETPAARWGSTILENLSKLQEAQDLCRSAEHHAEAGRLAEACDCYEKAEKLCPGSRYASLARERGKELHARLDREASRGAAEEQEIIPPPRAIEIEIELLPRPRIESNRLDLESRTAEALQVLLDSVGDLILPRVIALAAQDAGNIGDLNWRSKSDTPRLYPAPAPHAVEEEQEAIAPAPQENVARTLIRQLLGGIGCSEVDASKACGLRARCNFGTSALQMCVELNQNPKGQVKVEVKVTPRPEIESAVWLSKLSLGSLLESFQTKEDD